MTMIQLPADLALRLEAAATANGDDLNHYAVAILEQVLDNEEMQDSDEDLIAALREGIADADAGRTVSLEEMRNSALAALATHPSKVSVP